MKIAVGSASAVKIAAVRQACAAHGLAADIVGIDVPSSVNAQPLSLTETAQGALNRARAALAGVPGATLGVGLEGGIMPPVLDDPQVLPLTLGFAAVTDGLRVALVTTNGTPLPLGLADAMLNGTAELRPLAKQLGLPYEAEAGVLGILTRGAMRRLDSDSAAVRTALAPWINPAAYEA